MKKLFGIAILFLITTSAYSAGGKVILDCENSWSQKKSIAISKDDYDFLMFGNNHLRSTKISIFKTKRKKTITLVDNLDNNIETGIYTCVVRKSVR